MYYEVGLKTYYGQGRNSKCEGQGGQRYKVLDLNSVHAEFRYKVLDLNSVHAESNRIKCTYGTTETGSIQKIIASEDITNPGQNAQ